VPRKPPKGERKRRNRGSQSNRRTSTEETYLIGRHPLKETKPTGGHLQKETESIAKETEKIDRENPLIRTHNTQIGFHQTHYISSSTRRTSPTTVRGRGGTENGGGNLIAEPRVVETKEAVNAESVEEKRSIGKTDSEADRFYRKHRYR